MLVPVERVRDYEAPGRREDPVPRKGVGELVVVVCCFEPRVVRHLLTEVEASLGSDRDFVQPGPVPEKLHHLFRGVDEVDEIALDAVVLQHLLGRAHRRRPPGRSPFIEVEHVDRLHGRVLAVGDHVLVVLAQNEESAPVLTQHRIHVHRELGVGALHLDLEAQRAEHVLLEQPVFLHVLDRLVLIVEAPVLPAEVVDAEAPPVCRRLNQAFSSHALLPHGREPKREGRCGLARCIRRRVALPPCGAGRRDLGIDVGVDRPGDVGVLPEGDDRLLLLPHLRPARRHGVA
mmetsp:Transcript_31969/g.75925  ORF Transcript_31969/g.75925 Transcript_31969/m.75925 type:complete len:289 (-) Transcript_31969:237-1103(-)